MKDVTKRIEIALNKYFVYNNTIYKDEETIKVFVDTWGMDNYELFMQETENGFMATLESETEGFIYGNNQPLDLETISDEILEAYWSNESDYQEDSDF